MTMKTRTFGILNGPNLDRLGKREPEVYGSASLAELEDLLASEAESLGVKIDCFQSNHEGALIDRIAEWADAGYSGFVFNPGAFTHTSIALQDAIRGSDMPCIEVHLSNIHRREPFRQQSLTAPACVGIISGLGFGGYVAALRHLTDL